MKRLNVGIIGAGRVGATLAAKFRNAGYEISGVSGRSAASNVRIRTLLPGVNTMAPSEVAAGSDILVIAVPDDALEGVVEQLADARAVAKGATVLHTSGRHGLRALAPLAAQGACPIALHPAMTFTGTEVDLKRTCVFGVTAGPREHDLAETLVSDLGGTLMWIDEDDRALYHAALAHGANHLGTLVLQAMDLLRQAGAPDASAVLRPLLTAALDNVLAYGDAALTGPVVRGDLSTIRAHLDAFAQAGTPSATTSAYAELARATTTRAWESGRLSVTEADGVRRVLTEADWDAMAETVSAL